MENIDNIIEIKRGLHKICGRSLVNAVADLDQCEGFYRDVFQTYGLIYNTETIRQKRVFTVEITKYFILSRLPEGCLTLSEGKYESNDTSMLKEQLTHAINTFYMLLNTCDSKESFKQMYAEHFNEEIKDFSKEISENRDDSLSDFAKVVKKIYHSKDKPSEC